jgi:hypothetical protein
MSDIHFSSLRLDSGLKNGVYGRVSCNANCWFLPQTMRSTSELVNVKGDRATSLRYRRQRAYSYRTLYGGAYPENHYYKAANT